MLIGAPDIKDADLFQLYQLAKRVAKKAGNLIFSLRFPAHPSSNGHAKLTIDQKSNSTDLVTTADIASQRLVFSALRDVCPDFRFIGEEDGAPAPLDENPTWIVDAIDGTTNYVHGLHDFAVCIALSIGKKAVLGVVYNPCSHEMFSALQGYGAFLNDDLLCVSECKHLRQALVLSEWGYERSTQGIKLMLQSNERLLMKGVRAVRQLGSGALDMCYVAAGRADAVIGGIAEKDTWQIWDYAAAFVIAEEAGAVFRTVDGGPFHIESESLICCTPAVLQEIVDTIRQ